jgi:hypothetical protein
VARGVVEGGWATCSIMKFNDQSRHCHAEPFASLKGKLREASRCPSRETLRFAQGDNPLPILIFKLHNRADAGLKRAPQASLRVPTEG